VDRGFKKYSSDFVALVYPIAELALYSKNPMVGYFACQAIKHLSFVDPTKFYASQMDSVYYALQTLTETHRTRAAFELTTVTVHPFLKLIQEKDFIGNVLELSLDGIDSNDAMKTYQTLTLFSRIFDTVPIFQGGSSSVDDKLMPEFNYTFEDWILKFFDRFFICLEKQSPPEKKRTTFDTSLNPIVLDGVFTIFFSQMSDEIYKNVSKRIISFFTGNFLPNAKKQIGMFCTCASKKSEFVKSLFMALYEKVVSNDELKNLTSSEISYYLYLMGKTLRGIGGHSAIPELKKEIFNVLKLTWCSSDKNTLKNSGKLIRAITRSLGNVYPLDYKSVPEDEWNSEKFQKEHWTNWGRTCDIENINMKWHVPSDNELNLLAEFYDAFIESPYSELKNCKEFKEAESSALIKLRYIIRGYATLLPVMDGDDTFYTKTSHYSSGNIVLKRKLKYSRSDVAVLLHELAKSSSNKLDPKFTNLLIKNIHSLITKPNSKKSNDGYNNYKKQIFNSFNEKSYPRYYLVSYVNELYQRRLSNFHQVFTQHHKDLLEDLKSLSISLFSVNRKKAQKSFISGTKSFKEKLLKSYIPEFLEALRSKDIPKEKLTGSMYMLLNKSCIKAITSNWELMIDFVKSLLQCTEIEEESDQQRLNLLFSTYITSFQELSFKDDKYNEVLKELISTVDGKQHWKTQLMNLTFLSLFIRSDYKTFYPMEGIKLFIDHSLSDIQSIRISAIKTLDLIFTQYKPIQPKKKFQFETKFRTFDDASNVQQPKNEKEWNETIFFDKNYFGYYSYPKEILVYDYSKQDSFQDQYFEQRKEFLKNVEPLLNEKWIEKLLYYLSLQNQSPLSMQGSGYSFGFSQFFKGLFQLFGIEMFKKFQPFLEKLLSNAGSGTPEEENQIHLGLEIIGGVSRGMKHWKFDHREYAISELSKILKSLFEICSLTTLQNIQSCFRFCSFDTDIRRIRWLVDLTLANVDLETGTSSNQSKRLKLLSPILSEISWRDRNSQIKLIQMLVKHLDHSFQQVREFIADSLSQFMRFYSYVPRDEKTSLLTYSAQEKKEEYNSMIIDSIKKKYQESEDKGNVTKTLLSYFARVSRYESFFTSVYIQEIIPMVISIYDDTSSDPDLQSKSRQLFISISSSIYKKNVSNGIMNLIQYLNTYESWRVRFGILTFLQIFGYRHEFYLNSTEILKLLTSLLSDKSVEVRNLASKTLAGFIKSTNNEKVTMDLVDQFVGIKPKKPKTEAEILSCHSTVLGLSAIISAYPYSIPDFLPKVIFKLTSYANYRVPIGTSAKECFADFWKTHQDNWNNEFKHKFTDDELYAITQLKGSNQYFV
jgi:proteasome activator subunit 4